MAFSCEPGAGIRRYPSGTVPHQSRCIAPQGTDMNTDHITHAAILTPVEARQGVISGRVQFVLAVSLTLLIVAFVAVYVVGR